MKKRLLTLLFAATITLSVTACGEDENTSDKDFLSQVGITQGDDTTTGTTNSSNAGTDNSKGMILYDIDQEDSLFPVESLGVYAYTTGYNAESITIEPDKLTYHTASQDYVFTSPEYSIIMEDRYTTRILKDDKEVLYINHYYSYEESRIEINACFTYYNEEVGMDCNYYYSCGRIDAVNYAPLEYYNDLDDDGTWGAIPYSEELAAHLLNNFTDDYMIQYSDYMIVGIPSEDNPDEKIYYDTLYYQAKCYNEEGYQYNKTITVYVLENEEIASAYYDVKYAEHGSYSNHEVILDGNMVIHVYDSSYQDEEFSLWFTKKDDASSAAVVYDKHCVYSGRMRDYYYFSKPFTANECKDALYIGQLAAKMSCLNVKTPDGNYQFSVSGDGFDPYLSVMDVSYEVFGAVHPTEYRAADDTLIGYEYDDADGRIAVTEFSLSDGMLNVNLYLYDLSDDITLDNYQDATPKETYNFSVEHVYTVW